MIPIEIELDPLCGDVLPELYGWQPGDIALERGTGDRWEVVLIQHHRITVVCREECRTDVQRWIPTELIKYMQPFSKRDPSIWRTC